MGQIGIGSRPQVVETSRAGHQHHAAEEQVLGPLATPPANRLPLVAHVPVVHPVAVVAEVACGSVIRQALDRQQGQGIPLPKVTTVYAQHPMGWEATTSGNTTTK